MRFGTHLSQVALLALLALLAAVLAAAGCAAGKASTEPLPPDSGQEQADGWIVSDSGTEADQLGESLVPDSSPPDGTPAPDTQIPVDGPGVKPDTSVPKELCSNGKDDDGDQRVDCADLASCGQSPPCLQAGRGLVLHEVYPGTIDYLVLRNASTVALNTKGYTLEMFGAAQVSFSLPARSLAPGKTVAVFEFADGGPGDINSGANLPFYDGVNSNAVTLRSPAGAVQDYVGFGTKLLGVPPGVTLQGGPVSYGGFNVSTQSHQRAGMKGSGPGFQRSDWRVQVKSR